MGTYAGLNRGALQSEVEPISWLEGGPEQGDHLCGQIAVEVSGAKRWLDGILGKLGLIKCSQPGLAQLQDSQDQSWQTFLQKGWGTSPCSEVSKSCSRILRKLLPGKDIYMCTVVLGY